MVLNRQNVFAVKTDHSYDNGNESSTFPSIFQVFFNSIKYCQSLFQVFFKSFSSLVEKQSRTAFRFKHMNDP